jgi:hypothetical protein
MSVVEWGCSFQIDLRLPDEYPDTPMARKIKNEESGVAGTVIATVSGLNKRLESLDKEYSWRKHGMSPDKKLYVHINAFYIHPMKWEYQKLALPGELDTFRGRGRWLLCKVIHEVLSQFNLSPKELGVTLEASGGECRFAETPKFPELSDDDIMVFLREYFAKDEDSLEEEIEEKGKRKALTEWLCFAQDELKLIRYYERYGLVPVLGKRASANSTFMYGDATTVLATCDADPPLDLKTPPTFSYTITSKRLKPAEAEQVHRPLKRRR